MRKPAHCRCPVCTGIFRDRIDEHSERHAKKDPDDRCIIVCKFCVAHQGPTVLEYFERERLLGRNDN